MQTVQDKFFILILILIGVGIAYLLTPVLTPFVVSGFLAYLFNPLVNKIVGFNIPRIVGVIIVFFLLIGIFIVLFLLLIPFVERQVIALGETIPRIITWVQEVIIPWLSINIGFKEESINMDAIKTMIMQNWTKAGGVTNWLFKATLYSGSRLLEWLMNLLLIPVVTFYLLCDWEKLMLGLRNLLPRRLEPTVVKLLKEGDEVLRAFFQGQLMVILSLATLYSIGLTLVGLPMGLLIGLIAGLLNIIPYLGFITGITIASITAFIQFGTFTSVFLVIIVFLISQAIDNAFLTPKLVGERIGLHPVAVIFAILAGGNLFGFLGVLLALPIAAFIMVWLRYFHKQYRHSQLYRSH